MDSPSTDLSVFTRQVSHQETNPTSGATSPSHSSSNDKGKARATEVLQGAAEQLTRQQEQQPGSWSMLTPEDYNTALREPDSQRILAIREKKIRDRAKHLAAEEDALKTPFHIAFGRELKSEARSCAKQVKEKWYKMSGTQPTMKVRESGKRAYDEAEEAKLVAKLGKGAWPWNEDGQRPNAKGVYPCTYRKAQVSDTKMDHGPAETKEEGAVNKDTETDKTAGVTETTETLDSTTSHNAGGSISPRIVSTPPITRWGRPEPPRSPLSHKASMMPVDLPGRRSE